MKKNFIAEFIGTFALVFVGSGAIIMTQYTSNTAGLLQVALAHGIILAVMVSAAMNISGAQFNPAVTLGLLVARRITPTVAGVHIVAQLIGGLAAAYALKMTMPAAAFAAAQGGAQVIALEVTATQAVLLEFIATFFLMFVIYGTAVHTDAPRIGGLAIGLTIAADILTIGPLTGASMNPARSLAPALASGIWTSHWIYWAGPIMGMTTGGAVWRALSSAASAPASDLMGVEGQIVAD